MNAAEIDALMKKHNISEYTLNGAGHSGAELLSDGRWKLTFGGLPNLGFFVELAALAGVPIESIQTDSDESYGGCDTCGYGAGVEYFAYVAPKPGADDGR
jgi:hypothetical protein